MIDRGGTIRLIAAVALIGTAAGCRSVSGMRALPENAGREVRYAAPPDEVRRVVPQALDAVGYEVIEDDPATGRTIARKGSVLFGGSEISRVLVRSDSTVNQSRVRFVFEPMDLVDMWGAGASSARFIGFLDEALGPDRIALSEGMVVRGWLQDGSDTIAVRGTLTAASNGSHGVLSEEVRDGVIPLELLDDVTVFRGSYRNAETGMWIGALLGAGVMAVWVSTTECDWFWEGSCRAVWSLPIGMVLGTAIGGSIKTEIWSSLSGR